jgi:hypothetical protein
MLLVTCAPRRTVESMGLILLRFEVTQHTYCAQHNTLWQQSLIELEKQSSHSREAIAYANVAPTPHHTIEPQHKDLPAKLIERHVARPNVVPGTK